MSAIAFTTLFFVGPISQDPGYHLFADSNQILGLKNFWNVVSNLPFFVAGFIGLSRYSRLTQKESRTEYLVLCVAVLLVGLGSSYYHHNPSNSSLLWDRLPMTVAFMALFSMLLSERVMTKYNRASLWLLVTIGVSSAVYWSLTESLGRGDLRPYVFVQFLPILLMPLILFLFPSRYLSNSLLLSAFALYFVAKALEHFDTEVFSATGLTGGHALKHVVAAVAVICIIYSVPARRPCR